MKVPRFAFEKFPNADQTLTTTMKSVGEAMAIGRNFTEALQRHSEASKSAVPLFPGRRARTALTLPGSLSRCACLVTVASMKYNSHCGRGNKRAGS